MSVYAVIDTNVLISALLSKKPDAATVKIIKAITDGKIIPLIHEEILAEYEDVLHRDKFHLQPATIQTVMRAFRIYGVEVAPQKSDETFSDPDDLIFYEIALAQQDRSAYLVTGNQRHYPDRNFIVTPAHMIHILESSSD